MIDSLRSVERFDFIGQVKVRWLKLMKLEVDCNFEFVSEGQLEGF